MQDEIDTLELQRLLESHERHQSVTLAVSAWLLKGSVPEELFDAFNSADQHALPLLQRLAPLLAREVLAHRAAQDREG
ncbi:hypothetical protein JWJ88_17135 [Paracoccus methylovorus]|uniref:Uncharacterized protein n=1 Tax=Paracoccus methylovorus TaxID=2812658 RepID=A0ABX7JN74_9RHOB|nr:hypothetical protein [Paracoccus methylovorus]QRZ14688.1 hypothetical protein JWJ88_17135 [Paracoccus methylovorus]